MKEERLQVLKMLEDKKITTDEAMKLLDSLKGDTVDNITRAVQSADMEEKLNKFSQSVDSFAKDFSDKMSNAFKDMEPRLRQATKTVVEKTACVVDDISKSLNESLKNMEERMDSPQKVSEEQVVDQTENFVEEVKDQINDSINENVQEALGAAEDKPGEN